MQTIRAFIAIEIDQPSKKKLTNLIACLKKSNADIKWVNENQMHITLKFLGSIENNRVSEISTALKSITSDFTAFVIHFSKIGGFPDLRQPRVIWLGIDKGSESLKQLNAKVELSMERLGLEKERRDYKAHFTLGRVKSLKNIQKLLRLIDATDSQMQGETKIDKLILFRSILTPKGAIHTALAEFQLSTPAGEA